MTEKPDKEEKEQPKEKQSEEYGHWLVRAIEQAEQSSEIFADMFEHMYGPFAGKVESTTDAINTQAKNIEEALNSSLEWITVDERTQQFQAEVTNAIAAIREENAAIKSQTGELVNKLQEDTGLVMAIWNSKAIPALEQRVKTLEEANERKRNWGVNVGVSEILCKWALFRPAIFKANG